MSHSVALGSSCKEHQPEKRQVMENLPSPVCSLFKTTNDLLSANLINISQGYCQEAQEKILLSKICFITDSGDKSPNSTMKVVDKLDEGIK